MIAHDDNLAKGKDPIEQQHERINIAALFDGVTEWKNLSFEYNKMKGEYKQSYANAYCDQSGSEAAKKTMAEAVVFVEKQRLDDKKVEVDAAYFELQINFIIADKQFVGVPYH
jgi:hypothetical protein